MKRIILLCLILASSLLANPLSVEFGLSGGLQHLYTNDDLFNNDPREIRDGSTDNYFMHCQVKPVITGYFKHTGIYISADKLIGDSRFNRYWIISGGLKQRINLSENTSLDLYAGTTWHSVNAAIHSFMMFLIYTHFKSDPGIDAGLVYNKKLSDKLTLTADLNYNYNMHYNDSFDFELEENQKSRVRTISLSVGMMFTLL